MATVTERLQAIEAQSGWALAFDGCHKLYFCQDEEERKDAEETGYTIYPITEVTRLYRNESCGLRFVHPWNLSSHEFDIRQGDED